MPCHIHLHVNTVSLKFTKMASMGSHQYEGSTRAVLHIIMYFEASIPEPEGDLSVAAPQITTLCCPASHKMARSIVQCTATLVYGIHVALETQDHKTSLPQ